MIYIGADSYGYQTIQSVMSFLISRGIKFENIGVRNIEEKLPLEKLIPELAGKVLENKENLGILSCGTGIGVAVGANKIKGIRAVLVIDEKSAEWSRKFDDCNVLCLRGWEMESNQIEKIINSWLEAKFDGDSDRIKMLEEFDNWR